MPLRILVIRLQGTHLAPTTSSSKRSGTKGRTAAARRSRTTPAEGLGGLAEQLINRIVKPLGLVLLSGERIQATLDEAADRGRVTRSDANALAAQLVELGRQQTDELLADIEGILGRGRDRIDNATLRARRIQPVDRLVQSADRARRTVGVGPPFPIIGYDDLTARQIQQRLPRLNARELRKVRGYERRRANRKSVLEAIEKRLG